jgi:hypothetical protein
MTNRRETSTNFRRGDGMAPNSVFSKRYRKVKSGKENTLFLIKRAIWIYFLLLIFEGGFRKWIFPGIATPLLIVRDPIAIWILITAYNKGILKTNVYINGALFLGIFGVFTSLIFGHGSLPVALFGARAFLIHFPLIFVIGNVFDREDVIEIGRKTLIIAIPMALLVALQFYSPQTSLVNKGVGDVEVGGFSGAMGYSRPPGTFSFTSGLTAFYGFVACYVFYFWLNPKLINKLILIAATSGLLIVIPLSISRGLFFSIGVILAFIILASVRKPENILRMVIAAIGVFLLVTIASQFSFFQTAIGVFTARFENANDIEGGVEGVLIDRYLGALINSVSAKSGVPFFGYGLGTFSNVGSVWLSGKTVLGIAEGEWGRQIGESGLILGLIVVFSRIGFSYQLSLLALRKLGQGDLLPWTLLSFFLLNFPQGSWAQPTSLGFSTILAGLVIASLNMTNLNE